MAGFIGKTNTKKTVWTPQDRLDKRQATAGLPAWSHGNDSFAKLFMDGGSATDIAAGSSTHPYMSNVAYFDGSGDYISVPASSDFNLGTGDFTIEGWFNNPTANTTMKTLFSLTSTTNGLGLLIGVDNGVANQVLFNVSSNDSSWDIINGSGQGAYSANTWTHVAAVRSGNTFYLFVNGVQTYTNTSSLAVYFPNAPLVLGARTSTSISQLFTGYLADWRVSKGIAKYTSNFAVPASPLVADSYTKLLLPMNEGMNQVFKDYSGTGKTITRNGATQKTLVHPYQNVSGYFDGTGDYLTVPNNTDFNFGTGDFTIRGWFNFSSTPGSALVSKWLATGNQRSWEFAQSSGNLYFYTTADGSNSFTAYVAWVPNIGTWHYLQVTRSSGVVSFYCDGKQVGSSTSLPTNIFNGSALVNVGSDNAGTTGLFNGFMADVEVSNIAKPVTVPTEPLTSDANTKLLLPMSTLGTVFTDTTGKTVTTNGDAKQVYHHHPYAKVFGMFDGSGDYLAAPYNTAWNFAGEFTVSTWVYGGGSSQCIFATTSTIAAHAGCALWMTGANTFTFAATNNGSSWNIGSTGFVASNMTTNAWNYVRLVRDASNTVRLYVNGVEASGSTVISGTFTTAQSLVLGCFINSAYFFNGLMADFEVASVNRGNTVPTSYINTDSNTKLYLPMHEGFVPTAYDATGKQAVGCGSTVGIKSIARHPYSTVAGVFDGSGDYLSLDSHTDFDLQGDFSLECMYNFSATTGNHVFFNRSTRFDTDMASSSYRFMFAASTLYFNWNNAGSLGEVTVSFTPTVDTWYHIALVRSGSNLMFYVNGRQVGSTGTMSASPVVKNRPLEIGSVPGLSWFATGKMTDARVSNTARYASNFSAPSSALTSDANTKLLLPMATLGTTFTDATGKTVTRYGDAKQIVCNPDIAKVLTYTDTNSYVFSPYSSDFDLGTSDFSLEWWMLQDSVGSNIIEINSTAFGVQIANSGGNVVYKLSYNGSSWDITSGRVIAANETGRWIHMAICRQGANIYSFKDGVLTDTYNIGASQAIYNGSTNNFYAGRAGYFVGKFGWVHFVKGSALYTANFTPPTTPQVHANSKLVLMPGEKSTSFNDYSSVSSPKMIERGGDTRQIVSYHKPPLKTFAQFNGSSDYLTVPYSSDSDIAGTTPWTIETWFNCTAWTASSYNALMTKWAGTYTLFVGISANGANGIQLSDASGWNIFTGLNFNFILSSWYHFKLTFDGSKIRVFINGVKTNEVVAVRPLAFAYGQGFEIGSYNYNGATRTHFHNGYMSDFRFRVGIADNSTIVPTEALTVDKHTVLHLPMSDAGTNFYDKSGKRQITVSGDVKSTNKLITNSGVTFIPDSTCPVSGRVMNFNGSSYMTIPDSNDWNLTSGDFTIDCWFNGANLTGWNMIVNQEDASEYIFGVNVYASGVQVWDNRVNALWHNVIATSLSNNTWYHLAVVRSGNEGKVFINGNQIGTTYTMSNTPADLNGNITVGRLPSYAGSPAQYFNGKMTQLRISKGIARWTRNFTPPTSPFE